MASESKTNTSSTGKTNTSFFINYNADSKKKVHDMEEVKKLAKLRAEENNLITNSKVIEMMSSLDNSVVIIKSTFIDILNKSDTFEMAYNAVNNYYDNFSKSLENVKQFNPNFCTSASIVQEMEIFHNHLINVSEILKIERCEFDTIKFHVHLLVPDEKPDYFGGIDLVLEYATKYGESSTYHISLLIKTFMLSEDNIAKICHSCNMLLEQEKFKLDYVVMWAKREGALYISQPK